MYNECRHLFTSGRKCQSPALRDQPFCYFHGNHRRRPTPKDKPYEPFIPAEDNALDLLPVDDADAIQLALSDVILALAANRIDPRRAKILIYGLQAASQNLRLRTAQTARTPHDRTQDLGIQHIVRETHKHDDGTLIGPAKETPDPEEIAKKTRPMSLGQILLRQAEALEEEAEQQAKEKAEQQAREAAEKEAAEKKAQQQPTQAESDNQPIPITLPQLQGTAATYPKRCHPERSDRRERSRRACPELAEGTRASNASAMPCTARPAFHTAP